jgi:DNA-binding response OmpR family regulator
VAVIATVLVVEDDRCVRRLLRSVLARAGYSVLCAADPADALLCVWTYFDRIDLILTDVVMPGMDGPELARRVARARPGTALLFMSGYVDETLAEHGLSARAHDLIVKPFTPRELLRRVEAALRHPPVEREFVA